MSAQTLGERDFRAIYDAHFGFVWRTLRRFGVREEDAGDLVQAVFLVAFARLDDFEGRSKLDTWLFSICYRVACNARRARLRRREVAVDPVSLDSYAAWPQDSTEARDCLLKVEAILRGLPWRQSQVFVLSEVEELRDPEIARRLGISGSTVKYRLRTARRQFTREARRLRLISSRR